MIVEPRNSQIDEESIAPLVWVKNGIWSHIFSNGLLDVSLVKKLKLPDARYDYLLEVVYFTMYSGVPGFTFLRYYPIKAGQTSVELELGNNYFAFVRAEFITKEI